MRSLTLTLMLSLMSSPVAAYAATDTFFHWQDARGVVHVSNRADRVPDGAASVELETHPAAAAEHNVPRPPASAPVLEERRGCPPPDTSGLVGAVLSRLVRTGRVRDVDTLLVAAEPVLIEPGSDVLLSRRYGDQASYIPSTSDRALSEPVHFYDGGPYVVDELAKRTVATEQAAVAYPADAPCPARPPLAQYPVASARARGRSVCDDYQRAFAQVGVAVSRDHGVARSFRDIAKEFATAATRRYLVGPENAGVQLPAWIVEAHVAQVDEIASETASLANELTVALEEVDHAARARGCW